MLHNKNLKLRNKVLLVTEAKSNLQQNDHEAVHPAQHQTTWNGQAAGKNGESHQLEAQAKKQRPSSWDPDLQAM